MPADLLDRLLVTLAVRLRAFSTCRIQQGWRLGFGAFNAVTIHYVLRGTGSVRVGTGPWVPFGAHTIIIVPARLPHTVGEPEEYVAEVRAEDHCSLHGDGLVAFTAGDGTPDTIFVCGQISESYDGALGLFELFQTTIVEPFALESVVHTSFELMLAEVASPGLGTQAMTEVLMKQCLIVLLRRHLLSGSVSSPLLAALKEPKLARAVLTVLEQPAAPYTVDSLAALAGMGRTAFAVSFSRVFGQAPMDFVQSVRLRIAARLLTSTDLPVKVIANSIGYASRTSFSRAFEACYGAAPANFRAVGSDAEAEPQRIEGHSAEGGVEATSHGAQLLRSSIVQTR